MDFKDNAQLIGPEHYSLSFTPPPHSPQHRLEETVVCVCVCVAEGSTNKGEDKRWVTVHKAAIQLGDVNKQEWS